jgi:16S rRNA processing protein RimM
MSDLICIGAIAGAFGVSGEVRLKSFCSEPADIASYGPLLSEDGDALRGTSLFVARDRLPALPDDEFYHADLIGLAALDTGGAALGIVTAIHNHGAGDIIEISPPGHKSALLLPFTKAIVPNVDLAAGRLIVDPPEESE